MYYIWPCYIRVHTAAGSGGARTGSEKKGDRGRRGEERREEEREERFEAESWRPPPPIYSCLLAPALPFSFFSSCDLHQLYIQYWVYTIRTLLLIGWLFSSPLPHTPAHQTAAAMTHHLPLPISFWWQHFMNNEWRVNFCVPGSQ